MTRRPSLFVAFGLLLGATAPPRVHSQALPESLVSATTAAVSHLLEVDSLDAVAWPSAGSLLHRRPGPLLLSGISTRLREDPAPAIALTERVLAALGARGVQARSIPREQTRDFCNSGNATSCRLPDDVGLLLLVGYGAPLRKPPSADNTASNQVVGITIVADSRVRSGPSVISLDIHVEQIDGVWRVISMNRTRGAS